MPAPLVKQLGRTAYTPVWRAMQAFTQARRSAPKNDEIWLTEHEPVYTLGLAGNPAHLLHAGSISLVQTDRGGQITYHGPGQAVVYALLDLRRYDLKVRELVNLLEQTIIDVLADQQIEATRRLGMPGVYVGEAKVAALGLKVAHGCSYHGIALNVALDLAPFSAINPCGYADLVVTQTSSLKPLLGRGFDVAHAQEALAVKLLQHLSVKSAAGRASSVKLLPIEA